MCHIALWEVYTKDIDRQTEHKQEDVMLKSSDDMFIIALCRSIVHIPIDKLGKFVQRFSVQAQLLSSIFLWKKMGKNK